MSEVEKLEKEKGGNSLTVYLVCLGNNGHTSLRWVIYIRR